MNKDVELRGPVNTEHRLVTITRAIGIFSVLLPPFISIASLLMAMADYMTNREIICFLLDYRHFHLGGAALPICISVSILCIIIGAVASNKMKRQDDVSAYRRAISGIWWGIAGIVNSCVFLGTFYIALSLWDSCF